MKPKKKKNLHKKAPQKTGQKKRKSKSSSVMVQRFHARRKVGRNPDFKIVSKRNLSGGPDYQIEVPSPKTSEEPKS